MVQRKISLASQTQSSWGKIMLLTPFAYQNAEIRDDEELFHFQLFIEYHLYYLVNPYDPNGWIFLSFSSIDQINGRSYLKVLRNNGISDWINEFTFFRSEELLTILISVFIPFITPVTAILKAAQRTNSAALSLPGNPLEVSAAVSVIDASHHFHGQMSQSYTLEGQNGSIFIKNLIVNLISVRGFSKQNEISITYPVNKFNLERDFIDKCRIPFLYALDRSIPILDQISGSQSQSIYFSRYERTSNLSQIDGKFVFLLSQTEYTAVVECKNRQDSINGKILFECLTKARSKPGAKLCIIFCRICIPASTLRSKFMKFCRLKKINVYSVKREGNMAFKIEVFSDKFYIFPNPNFICIIFESFKINRDINFLEM